MIARHGNLHILLPSGVRCERTKPSGTLGRLKRDRWAFRSRERGSSRSRVVVMTLLYLITVFTSTAEGLAKEVGPGEGFLRAN